ncbi:Pimeloyl-ACP methyl ester carboxylesterase [Spirosomataceae bacterium TFI 002]|nr:Pimeloyl-ACP methyl ester carboxylesterase [Spirosomataceae bacterium TFI 002]
MKKISKILLILILVAIAFVFIFFGKSDLDLDYLKSKYATSPSQFVEIEGMNVHFRDEGVMQDSLPIVLIHGTGASLHTFEAWTKELKKTRRVLRMDLPAFGLTGPFQNTDYSIDHYVDFIQKFLTANGVEKCVLGGNSLGGNIAWQFTLEHPERVEKLILIDAAGYPFQSTSVPLAFRMGKIPIINKVFTYITPRSVIQRSVENVYSDKSKVTETLVDQYFELTLRAGNRQAFVDRMSMEKDVSPFERISEIKQSTLVLWGEDDFLIPVSSAERFHEDLPNDTLVIMKNLGHVPMEEDPATSLAVVMEFLKK